MSQTVWEKIFTTLKDNSIEVYPPATKEGECSSKYVVLKQDGSSQIGSLSSQVVYYTVMLYVPKNKYNQLEVFKKEVQDTIAKELFPLLMPTGNETPDFYDSSVKAHMTSVMYRVSKRNKHL